MTRISAISFVIFFLSASLSNAQDYSSIREGRLATFCNEFDNDLIFVETDSVIFFEKKTVYHLNRNVHESEDALNNWDCYIYVGPSILGYYITIKENGTNIFNLGINKDFVIQTMYKVDEAWIAYSDEAIIIEAKIADHNTELIFNVTDSVKIISFQAYNIENAPIEHEINNQVIKLSKNYGITETFTLSLLPDLMVPNYYIYYLKLNYKLCGLANPDIGVQNLTMLRSFDFDLFDEIHILEKSGGGYEDRYFSERKQILKFLNRVNYIDSTTYTLEKTMSYIYITYNNNQDSTIRAKEYFKGIIDMTIKSHYSFDRPSYVLNSYYPDTGYGNEVYYNVQNYYPNNNSSVKYYNHSFFSQYDGCLDEWHIDGPCYDYDKYFGGLGGPYFYCSWILSHSERSLVYYKKSYGTWGTQLQVRPFPELEEPSIQETSIFPNPFSDRIIVLIPESELPCTIAFYNNIGRQIFSQEITTEETEVILQRPLPRMIIYKLYNSDKTLKNGKLFSK